VGDWGVGLDLDGVVLVESALVGEALGVAELVAVELGAPEFADVELAGAVLAGVKPACDAGARVEGAGWLAAVCVAAALEDPSRQAGASTALTSVMQAPMRDERVLELECLARMRGQRTPSENEPPTPLPCACRRALVLSRIVV
jgi:hypothetical protein